MSFIRLIIVISLLFSGLVHAEKLYFNSTATEDGKLIVYRSFQSVPIPINQSAYPYLISIFWPYKQDNERGMPESSVIDSQYALEDMMRVLDVPEISHLALVVTGNGRKMWHWYAKDKESWMEKFKRTVEGVPKFPVKIKRAHQPDWRLYNSFIEWANGASNFRPDSEGNRKVIESLISNGSDIKKPHPLEHHFYCRDEETLKLLMAKGKKLGYHAENIRSNVHNDSRYWFGDLVKETALDLDVINKANIQMLRLASEFKLEYDGWGSVTVK